MAKILIVDDEIGIRSLLSEILADEGYEITTAENAQKARELNKTITFDAILLDIWMPQEDGLELLKDWSLKGDIRCPVIMMSGHGTIDTAVEATKLGATGFLEKPIALKKLLMTVENVIARHKQKKTFSEDNNSPCINPNINKETSIETKKTIAPCKLQNEKDKNLPKYFIEELNYEVNFNLPLKEARDAFERAYIQNILILKENSMSGLARHAQIERTHLYRKFKSLKLDIAEITHQKSPKK